MAYNPFNIFRRNQKVIFAVLTVFIMFMFTLSSGVVGGDFFETFSRWLGSKGKRGDPVCTIDGTKVYQGDLHPAEPGRGLRYQRVMANRYMTLAVREASRGLAQAARDLSTHLSPQAAQIMAGITQNERLFEQFGANPQFAGFLGEMIQKSKADLRMIIDSPTMKAEDKEAARAKYASIVLMEGLRGGDHYFISVPNQTDRDLIEFMLWQKKADQLGIKYTTADVQRLVLRELYGYFPDDVQKMIQRYMRESLLTFQMDACLKALGEEFRVRAAQAEVYGQDVFGGRGDKTYGAFPLFAPSYLAFEFYRDQCSPTTYAAIPISAENLLAEVDRRLALPPGNPERIAEPTDDELKKLFDQFQHDVPNPAKEQPGFKIPPKIRLQWIKLTGEEPYYIKTAEENLKQEALQAQLRSVIHSPLLNLSPVLAFNTRAFVIDPLTTKSYDDKVRLHTKDILERWSSPKVSLVQAAFTSPPLDTSVVRPANMAIAATAMGGQSIGFGNPLAGLAMTASGPMSHEIGDRVKAGMPAFLGMVPGPALLNTAMGGAVAHELMLPKPLPIEAYRGELVKDLIASRARELVFGVRDTAFGIEQRKDAPGDIRTFIDEVNKLTENGKARDKAPAQKFIAEFVAKRGLTIQGSKTPQSEWTLADDPELAPLVAAHRESVLAAQRDSLRAGEIQQGDYVPFATHFFWKNQARQSAITGTYSPEQYPERRNMFSAPEAEDKPTFLVWRAEEVAAAPVNFITAKDSVKAAWKRNKARELAKQKAEEIAEAIRKSDKSGDALIQTIKDQAEIFRSKFGGDERGIARTKEFSIRGVSPITSIAENPTGQRGIDWLLVQGLPPHTGPYRFFLTAFHPSENLKYPSPEFYKGIMDERSKDPRTVQVLTDAPKDIYFVTALLKREEKTPADFNFEIVLALDPASRSQTGGRLVWDRFRFEKQMQNMQSVLGLLKREFKYEESDEQKKRLDENAKHGGAGE
jgi:hypothetical protein